MPTERGIAQNFQQERPGIAPAFFCFFSTTCCTRRLIDFRGDSFSNAGFEEL